MDEGLSRKRWALVALLAIAIAAAAGVFAVRAFHHDAAALKTRLIYSSRAGIWEMNPATSARRLLLHAPGSGDAQFSPDGSRIVFDRESGDQTQVWVMNANGSSPRQLTTFTAKGDQPADNESPSWSPDGDKIAFICYDQNHQLCVVNADGSGFRELTHGTNVESRPVWLSPTKLMIEASVFASVACDRCNPPLFPEDRLYTLDIDGGKPVEIRGLPPEFWGPTLSPDATKLAYVSDVGNDSAIWRMNTDGSHQRQVSFRRSDARCPGALAFIDADPAWLRDGRLTFARSFDSPTKCKGEDLIVLDASGKTTRLTHFASAGGFSWAPDPTGSG